MNPLHHTDSTSDPAPSLEGFVPATQWDALRKKHPPRRRGARGLRSLSQAMQTENPDQSDWCKSSELRWGRSSMDLFHAGDGDGIVENGVVETALAEARAAAQLDACFASESFLDDLDWSLQTYDLCHRDFERDVSEVSSSDAMDAELEMLEAVQDLTRFVARTTPQRTRHVSAAGNPSDEKIPD